MSLLPLLAILMATAVRTSRSRPRCSPLGFPRQDKARLLQATAPMSEASTKPRPAKQVPRQSGLNYVDCPNCDQGRQENQLEWSPGARWDEVSCRYCKHRYPDVKYPMDKAVTVQNPRGNPAVPVLGRCARLPPLLAAGEARRSAFASTSRPELPTWHYSRW